MQLRLPAAAMAGALAASALLVLAGLQQAHTEQDLYLAGAVGLVSVGLFATRVLPDIVAAFLVFLLALAAGVAPPSTVFSGLASGGFWLLVAGIVLGVAVIATGLGTRLSDRMLALSGASYNRAVVIMATAGFLLGILIPSTIPRVLILIPVAASLAASLGYRPASRGAMGLCATAAAATLLPTYAIYTANLPTIVQFGAMDNLYALKTGYAEYFMAQFPVNLLRFAILLLVLVRFCPDPADPPERKTENTEPLSQEQWRLLVLLVGAIALWALDFVHGIAPAWIALAAATLVLWPKTGLLPKTAMKDKIDLTPAVLFGAIFCVSALARHVGLDLALAKALIDRMALIPGEEIWNIYAVFGFSVLMSHLTTAPAAPLVLVPFAKPLAEASGLPLETVAMIQMIGIASPLLPYQAPPLIVAMSFSDISTALLTRVCLALFAGVTVVGLPLTIVWWRWIELL